MVSLPGNFTLQQVVASVALLFIVLLGTTPENTSAATIPNGNRTFNHTAQGVVESGMPLAVFLEFLNQTTATTTSHRFASGDPLRASPLRPRTLRRRRLRVRSYLLQTHWIYYCSQLHQLVQFFDETVKTTCSDTDVVTQAKIDRVLYEIGPLVEEWLEKHLEKSSSFSSSSSSSSSASSGVRYVDRRFGNCERIITTVPVSHLAEQGGAGIVERSRDLRSLPTRTNAGLNGPGVDQNVVSAASADGDGGDDDADLVIYVTQALSFNDINVIPCQWDPVTGRPTILYMNIDAFIMSYGWGISRGARDDLRAHILHYYMLGHLVKGLGLERTLFDSSPTYFADATASRRDFAEELQREQAMSAVTSQSMFDFVLKSDSGAQGGAAGGNEKCFSRAVSGFSLRNRSMPLAREKLIREYVRPEQLTTQDMISDPLQQYVAEQFECHDGALHGAILENIYPRQDPSIVNSNFKVKFYGYDMLAIPFFNLFVTNLTWGFLRSTGWYTPLFERTNAQVSPWGRRAGCGMYDLCDKAPWRQGPSASAGSLALPVNGSFVEAKVAPSPFDPDLTLMWNVTVVFVNATLQEAAVAYGATTTTPAETVAALILANSGYSNASVFRAEFCFSGGFTRCTASHREVGRCSVFNHWQPIPRTEMMYFGDSTRGGYVYNDYCPTLSGEVLECEGSADSFCFDEVVRHFVAVKFKLDESSSNNNQQPKHVLHPYYTVTGRTMCARALQCNFESRSYSVYRTRGLNFSTQRGNLLNLAECREERNPITRELQMSVFADPEVTDSIINGQDEQGHTTSITYRRLYSCPQFDVVCQTSSEQQMPESWSRTGTQFAWPRVTDAGTQTLEALDDVVVKRFASFELGVFRGDASNSSSNMAEKHSRQQDEAVAEQQFLQQLMDEIIVPDPVGSPLDFWKRSSSVPLRFSSPANNSNNLDSYKIRFQLTRNDLCRYGAMLVMHWPTKSALHFNFSRLPRVREDLLDDPAALARFLQQPSNGNFSSVPQPNFTTKDDNGVYKLQNVSFFALGDSVTIDDGDEYVGVGDEPLGRNKDGARYFAVAALISEPLLSMWIKYEIDLGDLVSYSVPWSSPLPGSGAPQLSAARFAIRNEASSPSGGIILARVSLYSIYPDIEFELDSGNMRDAISDRHILQPGTIPETGKLPESLLGGVKKLRRTEAHSDTKARVGPFTITEAAFVADIAPAVAGSARSLQEQQQQQQQRQQLGQQEADRLESKFVVDQKQFLSPASSSSSSTPRWLSAVNFTREFIPDSCLRSNAFSWDRGASIRMPSDMSPVQLAVTDIGTGSRDVALKVSVFAAHLGRPTFSVASVSIEQHPRMYPVAPEHEVYMLQPKTPANGGADLLDSVEMAGKLGRWRRTRNATGWCLDPSLNMSTLVFRRNLVVDYVVVRNLLSGISVYPAGDPRLGPSILMSLPLECSSIELFVPGFQWVLRGSGSGSSSSSATTLQPSPTGNINTAAMLPTTQVYVTQTSRRNISSAFVPADLIRQQFAPSKWAEPAPSDGSVDTRAMRTKCFIVRMPLEALLRTVTQTEAGKQIAADLRWMCASSTTCGRRPTMALSFTPVLPRPATPEDPNSLAAATRVLRLGDTFTFDMPSGSPTRRDEDIRHPWFNLTGYAPFCPGIAFVGVYEHQRVTVTTVRRAGAEGSGAAVVECTAPHFVVAMQLGGFHPARLPRQARNSVLGMFRWLRLNLAAGTSDGPGRDFLRSRDDACGQLSPSTLFVQTDVYVPGFRMTGHGQDESAPCSGRGRLVQQRCVCDPGFGGRVCEICPSAQLEHAMAGVEGANRTCSYACDSQLPAYFAQVPWRDECIAAKGVMDPQDKCRCYCNGVLCFFTHSRSVTPEIPSTTTTTTSSTTTSTATTSTVTSTSTTTTATYPPGVPTPAPTPAPSTTTTTVSTTTSTSTTTTTPQPTFCPDSISNWYAVLSVDFRATNIGSFKATLWNAIYSKAQPMFVLFPGVTAENLIDVVSVCRQTRPRCYKWFPELLAGPDVVNSVVVFQFTSRGFGACSTDPAKSATFNQMMNNLTRNVVTDLLDRSSSPFLDQVNWNPHTHPRVYLQPIPKPFDYTGTRTVTPDPTTTSTTTTTTSLSATTTTAPPATASTRAPSSSPSPPSSQAPPTTPHHTAPPETSTARPGTEAPPSLLPTVPPTIPNATLPPLHNDQNYVKLLVGWRSPVRPIGIEQIAANNVTLEITLDTPDRWDVGLYFDCELVENSNNASIEFRRLLGDALLYGNRGGGVQMSSLQSCTEQKMVFTLDFYIAAALKSKTLATDVELKVMQPDLLDGAVLWRDVLATLGDPWPFQQQSSSTKKASGEAGRADAMEMLREAVVAQESEKNKGEKMDKSFDVFEVSSAEELHAAIAARQRRREEPLQQQQQQHPRISGNFRQPRAPTRRRLVFVDRVADDDASEKNNNNNSYVVERDQQRQEEQRQQQQQRQARVQGGGDETTTEEVTENPASSSAAPPLTSTGVPKSTQARKAAVTQAPGKTIPGLNVKPLSLNQVTREAKLFWRIIVLHLKYFNKAAGAASWYKPPMTQAFNAAAYFPADTQLGVVLEQHTYWTFFAADGAYIKLAATGDLDRREADTSSTVLLTLSTVALCAAGSPSLVVPVMLSSLGIFADRCRFTNPALGTIAGIHIFPSIPSSLFISRYSDRSAPSSLQTISIVHVVFSLMLMVFPLTRLYVCLRRTIKQHRRLRNVGNSNNNNNGTDAESDNEDNDGNNDENNLANSMDYFPRASYICALAIFPGTCYWSLVAIYASPDAAGDTLAVPGMIGVIVLAAFILIPTYIGLLYLCLKQDVPGLRLRCTFVHKGYESLVKFDRERFLREQSEVGVLDVIMRSRGVRWGVATQSFVPHILLPGGRWDFESDHTANLLCLFWFSDGTSLRRVRIGPLMFFAFSCSFLCLPLLSGKSDIQQRDGLTIPGSEYGVDASLCSLLLWLMPIMMCLFVGAVHMFCLVRHTMQRVLYYFAIIYFFSFSAMVWSTKAGARRFDNQTATRGATGTYELLLDARTTLDMMISMHDFVVACDSVFFVIACLCFVEAMWDFFVWAPLARSLDLQREGARGDSLSMQLLGASLAGMNNNSSNSGAGMADAANGGFTAVNLPSAPSLQQVIAADNNQNNSNITVSNSRTDAIAQALAVLEAADTVSRQERLERRAASFLPSSSSASTANAARRGARGSALDGDVGNVLFAAGLDVGNAEDDDNSNETQVGTAAAGAPIAAAAAAADDGNSRTRRRRRNTESTPGAAAAAAESNPLVPIMSPAVAAETAASREEAPAAAAAAAVATPRNSEERTRRFRRRAAGDSNSASPVNNSNLSSTGNAGTVRNPFDDGTPRAPIARNPFDEPTVRIPNDDDDDLNLLPARNSNTRNSNRTTTAANTSGAAGNTSRVRFVNLDGEDGLPAVRQPASSSNFTATVSPPAQPAPRRPVARRRNNLNANNDNQSDSDY